MGSVSIEAKRQEFPGKSDQEVAEALALKYGYVAIIRYKSHESGAYSDFGCCLTDAEIQGYLSSPACYDPESLYDARPRSLLITEDLLLASACSLCGKVPAKDSLPLGSPENFYFCPQCGKFFCPACYQSRLPLTDETSGYGMCPDCRIEVQKAIPGDYGKRPLATAPPPPGEPEEPPGAPAAAKKKWWRLWDKPSADPAAGTAAVDGAKPDDWKKASSSIKAYTEGAQQYNRGNYTEAQKLFHKAYRKARRVRLMSLMAAFAQALAGQHLSTIFSAGLLPSKLDATPEEAACTFVAYNLALYFRADGHTAQVTGDGSTFTIKVDIYQAHYTLQVIGLEGLTLGSGARVDPDTGAGTNLDDFGVAHTAMDDYVQGLLSRGLKAALPVVPMPDDGLERAQPFEVKETAGGDHRHWRDVCAGLPFAGEPIEYKGDAVEKFGKHPWRDDLDHHALLALALSVQRHTEIEAPGFCAFDLAGDATIVCKLDDKTIQRMVRERGTISLKTYSMPTFPILAMALKWPLEDNLVFELEMLVNIANCDYQLFFESMLRSSRFFLHVIDAEAAAPSFSTMADIAQESITYFREEIRKAVDYYQLIPSSLRDLTLAASKFRNPGTSSGWRGEPKRDLLVHLMQHMTEGKEKFEAGLYDTAAHRFRLVTDAEPDAIDAWTNQAEANGALERFEEATVCWEQAVRLESHDHDNWYNLIRTLRLSGDHRAALKAAERALAVDSGNSGAWCMKGASLREIEDYEAAIEAIDAALKIEPDYIWALYNKGACLSKLKQHSAAHECYTRIIALDPEEALAWNNKAVTEKRLRKPDEAIASFKKFIAVAGDHPDDELKGAVEDAKTDLRELESA
jgi:tetratricopeptide (TPR) repeat protein